jgi:hypothetical protein
MTQALALPLAGDMTGWTWLAMALPAVGIAWLIPAITAAGSALSGWLSNRKQTNTQTATPTLDPAYSGIQGMLLKQIQDRMAKPSALPAGYEAGQIGQINNTYGLVQQGLDNRMTARGLGSSPIAGAGETNLAMARAGDISKMQAGLPLLERQMQDQDLNLALQMMNTGRGQQATSTTPGNAAAGGLTSMANMLAYLYGQGAFSTTKKPATGYPQTAQNVWE